MGCLLERKEKRLTEELIGMKVVVNYIKHIYIYIHIYICIYIHNTHHVDENLDSL